MGPQCRILPDSLPDGPDVRSMPGTSKPMARGRPVSLEFRVLAASKPSFRKNGSGFMGF